MHPPFDNADSFRCHSAAECPARALPTVNPGDDDEDDDEDSRGGGGGNIEPEPDEGYDEEEDEDDEDPLYARAAAHHRASRRRSGSFVRNQVRVPSRKRHTSRPRS